MKFEYKRLKALGLSVQDGIVNRDELSAKLDELGISEKFSEYFGIQTQCLEGPWASDVEAVLERLASGKLTGTQLWWD